MVVSIAARKGHTMPPARRRKVADVPEVAKRYLSGSLDAKAFEAVVQSSKSDSGRCYAYFHAMWYADLTKDSALVDRFYGQLLKFDQLTCPSYLAFAKKFHPEGPQIHPPTP